MKNIICLKCGNEIETIPMECGQTIIYNEETREFECCMGKKCGYIPLSKLICNKCKENF